MELEQKSHLGGSSLLQGADLSPPGTVYQDIEATKALGRLVDNPSAQPALRVRSCGPYGYPSSTGRRA